jgi:MFS family permease
LRAAAASIALALVLLDVTAVAVLLPSIRLDLGASASGGQWVLNAYLVALAGALPLLVRLPARAAAAGGALGLAVGAIVCATADSTAPLVAGRALQGLGAAGLLAAVAGTAPETRRALTAAAVLPALALALGPLAGGAFGELNWWHVWFWAGVPLALVAGAVALAAGADADAPAPPPLRSLALAAGITGLTIALVQDEPWPGGWCAALALAGAVLIRVARPRVSIAWFAVGGALAALIFLMPEYYELARRLSTLRSSLLTAALTLPAVAAWLIATRIRWQIVPGLGVATAVVGLLALATLAPDTSYVVVLGGVVLAGGGVGLVAGALTGSESPVATSVASALAGATTGLAAAGAIFQHAQADERSDGASFESALATGVAQAALFTVVAGAVALLLTWRLRQRST